MFQCGSIRIKKNQEYEPPLLVRKQYWLLVSMIQISPAFNKLVPPNLTLTANLLNKILSLTSLVEDLKYKMYHYNLLIEEWFAQNKQQQLQFLE